jgi:hypothetical protein
MQQNTILITPKVREYISFILNEIKLYEQYYIDKGYDTDKLFYEYFKTLNECFEYLVTADEFIYYQNFNLLIIFDNNKNISFSQYQKTIDLILFYLEKIRDNSFSLNIINQGWKTYITNEDYILLEYQHYLNFLSNINIKEHFNELISSDYYFEQKYTIKNIFDFLEEKYNS